MGVVPNGRYATAAGFLPHCWPGPDWRREALLQRPSLRHRGKRCEDCHGIVPRSAGRRRVVKPFSNGYASASFWIAFIDRPLASEAIDPARGFASAGGGVGGRDRLSWLQRPQEGGFPLQSGDPGLLSEGSDETPWGVSATERRSGRQRRSSPPGEVGTKRLRVSRYGCLLLHSWPA